jgi:hypothetical protein
MKSVVERRINVRSLIDIRYVIESMTHFAWKELELSFYLLNVL